ncbi:TPA: hypothetical protein ACVQ66_003580 [Salmonella enterica subsp. enterica serovar Javiana]|nr:hypothetical protein [Salmonella enterica]EGW8109577.1 hypothetical protein [Salmonella enterica subsp. enterica serovar 4,[5],12:i:-]EDJ5680666.1 hypothetical protein [Salmonella enterica]EGB4284126.1 hypothetical protein [Salmonella enterica]EGM9876446.1 hypothetical protein [Salmonella enterica]
MKTKDIARTYETMIDVKENRVDSTGCIFQLMNSPIGLIVYVGEEDVYAIWDGQDEFVGGQSHLIHTPEGFDPTPVKLLAMHVELSELEDAARRIRGM